MMWLPKEQALSLVVLLEIRGGNEGGDISTLLSSAQIILGLLGLIMVSHIKRGQYKSESEKNVIRMVSGLENRSLHSGKGLRDWGCLAWESDGWGVEGGI